MAEAETQTVPTARIRIHDDTHRNRVVGSHNGVKFDLPVNRDITVSEGVYTALQDSGVRITTIEPLPGTDAPDEGSSGASVAEGTATRDEPETDDFSGEGAVTATHELSQATDKEATDSERTQSANVPASKRGAAKASDGGLTTAKRGLPADTSAAKTSPATKRATGAKRASSKPSARKR